MKTVQVNAKLLSFADWFERHVDEDHFDMAEVTVEAPCGTVACIAVWVLLREGKRYSDPAWENWAGEAAVLLGLNATDALHLFFPWESKEAGMPNPLWDNELTCNKTAALRVMRALAVR